MPKNKSEVKISETPEEEIKWDDNVDRLILYADIMGFSQRVMSMEHEKLKEELIKFRNAWIKKIESLKSDNLRSVQFSDSILVVVNGTDWEMFELLTKAAIGLMHVALDSGFPIKGVIAQGEFSYDKANELYFGLPLVNAYNLHNEVYYYGIVVHHSAEQIVGKFSKVTNSYTKTPIQLKAGKTSHYHLSWHLKDDKFHNEDIMDLAKKWLNKIEENVSGAPRIYVDNTSAVLDNDREVWNNMDEKVDGVPVKREEKNDDTL